MSFARRCAHGVWEKVFKVKVKRKGKIQREEEKAGGSLWDEAEAASEVSRELARRDPVVVVVCEHPYIVGSVILPCGQCLSCRRARSSEWALRVFQEMHYWSKSSFITLTYSDEFLPARGSLVKAEFQKFWKRVRKEVEPERVKYFGCGEYGEKFGRPHYHAIVFGLGVEDEGVFKGAWVSGMVDVGTCSYASARYVADYLQKKEKGRDAYPGREPPFQVMSQGLGLRFAQENKEQLQRNGFVSVEGRKQGIPRYYVKKLELARESVQEIAQVKGKELLERHCRMLGIVADKRKLTTDERRKVYESLEAERKQSGKNVRARMSLSRKGF